MSRIEEKVPKGQTREARRLIRAREEEEQILANDVTLLDDDPPEELFNWREDED